MFNKSTDDRISSWATFRNSLSESSTPLEDVWDFWKDAPFIPYNRKIDPYNQKGWPTPWEIIVDNKYDDFTKALMIGWTLKFSQRFKESSIEIRTMVDKKKPAQYNIVCIDALWAINYNDNGPISIDKVPSLFYLENLVELKMPR